MITKEKDVKSSTKT